MRSASALAVRRIVFGSAVFRLDDVIGEHPVVGFGLGTAFAGVLIDVLAAPAGTGDHLFTPRSVFGGEIERIGPLWLWLDRLTADPPADQ